MMMLLMPAELSRCAYNSGCIEKVLIDEQNKNLALSGQWVENKALYNMHVKAINAILIDEKEID